MISLYNIQVILLIAYTGGEDAKTHVADSNLPLPKDEAQNQFWMRKCQVKNQLFW